MVSTFETEHHKQLINQSDLFRIGTKDLCILQFFSTSLPSLSYTNHTTAMSQNLINANPTIYNTKTFVRKETEAEYDDDIEDAIDSQEVFDLIRSISDPEHPLTLEQLNVTQFDHIEVNNETNKVLIEFTPTIPHCSMATLIGLCIRVRLLRSLPDRFKVNYLTLSEAEWAD